MDQELFITFNLSFGEVIILWICLECLNMGCYSLIIAMCVDLSQLKNQNQITKIISS